jgi:hypothetical protein
VADGTTRVWIDVTLIPEEGLEHATKDVNVEFFPADDENIGTRIMPVVYKIEELEEPTEQDVDVEYLQTDATISGHINVAEEYYTYSPPMMSGSEYVNHEYFTRDLAYDVTNNIPHNYTTGYYSISGTLNKKVAFTSGFQRQEIYDTLVTYLTEPLTSGTLDYVVNYSNFSGNTNVSGEPIPFYNMGRDIIHEFTRGDDEYRFGGVDRIMDVHFAGYVFHHVGFDVYATYSGFRSGYEFDVTISGGGVDVNYLEAYSTALTVSGIDMDVYCALTDMANIPFEAETIQGRIATNLYEIFSCDESHGALNLDIDLYPLKITNFSLGIGEYTSASGFVSVDVLDDTCPVSTSGTYFILDGVRVPVTLSGIPDGYRMYYDPEDDFSSLEGPTTFTAHAENECGQSLEQDYYLTFGYIAEYDNHPSSWQGMDYGFKNKVAVRVTAENWASCPQIGSLAWDFESKEQFNNDLGASIVGQFYDHEASDISAKIRPQSLAYFYGREFEVVLTAKDFAGNEMEPLILTYRIEDKPEN